MKLRNYQTNAVNAIFDAWQKFKSVLVVLPTGCGKTVVFASVIKRLLDSPAAFNSVGEGLSSELSSDQQTNRPTDHVSPTESPSDCAGQPSVSEAQDENNHPCSAGRLFGCSDESSRKRQNDSKEGHALNASECPNPRVIVLAHREELVTQARDKITSIVPEADVQIEMADFTVADYFGKKADVVVSTVQTQCASCPRSATTENAQPKRMAKFDPSEFAAVVVDEAHHATARSYRECIDHYCQNENCRVLGVTATPDRADETALGNVFDTVAFEYTVTDAIEDGWLVPIRQKLVKVESLDFTGVSTSAGDLNSAELAEVMEDEKNLHGIVSPVLEICKGRRTILFASSVKHADRISEIINRSGKMKAEFVSGLTPKEERRAKLEAFKAGEIDVLCNVGVLTEGFDDSGVEVVVMARPTKSRALYAQMAGRATRPAAEIADKLGEVEEWNCQFSTSGKDSAFPLDAAAMRRKMIADSSKPSCLIVDFVGNSGRHKLVTTLDILSGKDIDEEAIRTRARKIIEASPDGTDTADAIAEARKEIAERKARDAKRREFIQASAKFVEIEVDPFNIYDLPPVERMANDRTRRLSLKQEMLLRTRLHVDPQQLGYARSNQLLQEFFRRANSGLASLPQSKLLKRFGIDVPLRSDEAKRIIDRCLAGRR